MIITLILCCLTITIGILLLARDRLKPVAQYFIGYGILNLICEFFKFMIVGQPVPFTGVNYIMFMINNASFIIMPCWLMFCYLQSYKLKEFYEFVIGIPSCAYVLLYFDYPLVIRGTNLINLMTSYYIGVLVLILFIGIIIFFYRKANLPQSLLLLAAAEGILQYIVALISPEWWYSWIVLSVYYLLIVCSVVVPRIYIDRIDHLSIESFGQ